MISIPLSKVGSAAEFAAAVEAHRSDVEKHLAGEPGVPAPTHDPLIESLIVRTAAKGPVAKRGPDKITIAPYEIVDDTPPPPTIEQRKEALLMQVQNAAFAARNAGLSPARQQLLALDIGDALGTKEEDRTAAQKAAVELNASFVARCAAINRVAVLASIEIEDLTAETIDGWKPPTF